MASAVARGLPDRPGAMEGCFLSWERNLFFGKYLLDQGIPRLRLRVRRCFSPLRKTGERPLS